MFLIEANRYIYYAIDYLFHKQQEPTPIAIVEVLKDKHARKIVEDFGGADYLETLSEMIVSEGNLKIFCEKLKQAYTKYKLCEICAESEEFLLSDKTEIMNPTELVSVVENKLVDLTSSVQQTKDIYKMGDRADEILSIRAENPESVPGLEMGWNKLDYYTNGGQPGDLIMVCARAKCVDAETEYFNGSEWKPISEYQDGEQVLQYNLDGTANLVTPLQYIKTPCEMMYHIETQRGVNIMASPEHKMLSVIPSRKGGYIYHDYTMEEIYEKHYKGAGFIDQFLTTFKYSGKGIELSNEEIRVMCAVICDGYFPKDSNKCVIRVLKERKKRRIRHLLRMADISWEEKQQPDNYISFVFNAPRKEKEFSSYWFDCNNEQLKIVCNEILHWDGCLLNTSRTFSTTSKDTADFIQFAYAATGERASIKIRDRREQIKTVGNKEYECKSVEYEMHITNRTLCGIRSRHKKVEIKKVKPIDGYKYCFTVPSSYLVLRRGNSIMIHHNCGKSTLLTNWATKLAIGDQIPLIYFDTEMDSRQQEDRILSILSGVPHKEIVSGMYVIDTENGRAEKKIEALKAAVQMLKDGNYYHIYMPNFTIDKVNAVAKKFKMQHDIQAIFFDYLKFPSSQVAGLKSVQEWQMLGYITSGLKDLAGTLGLPVYSACQENRNNVSSSDKDATNIGGSDRILQLASKMLFLVNKTDEEIAKEGESNGNQRLIIKYQRNGESDCPPINLRFDRPRLTIKEV